MNNSISVALLVGGASSEREVSKLSSFSIYNALKSLNYNVILIDPGYGCNQPKNDEDFFKQGKIFEVSTKNYIDTFNLELWNKVDLAFIGLHGKWGEDGTIQSLLELRNIKYTGSGVLASSLAMDKEMSKIIFKDHGVSIPKDFVIEKNDYDLQTLIQKIKTEINFPIIVKPNDEGSTVGLTVCNDESNLKQAIELSFQYTNKTMIEQFISGRELTVAILDSTALPIIEIKPKHFIYDYECKYTKGMSEYFVPAEIPEEVTKEMQRQALIAHQSLGCKSYSRVDFRMTDNNEIYCLEVNTLPGMTSTSLIPKAAKVDGISFEELIERIIKSSLK